MKTFLALLAVIFGLSFAPAKASESISTERTHDLSYYYHHHHHHHHWWWRHHHHWYPY